MYYRIKTQKAEYNLVEEIRNDKINIYIGGETFSCTEVIGGFLHYNKSDDSDCFLVKYDSWDASDMMSALFYYYHMKHKGTLPSNDVFVKGCRVELTDYSSNKALGNLSSYYLAFYGKTLYEMYFNAYVKKSNIQMIYNKQKFVFDEKYTSDKEFETLLIENGVETQYIKIILDIYKEASTYRKFFDNLKIMLNNLRKENETVAENFIKPWLDEFIKINLGFSIINDISWVIECKNVDIDFTGYAISTIDKTESLPKWLNKFIGIEKKAAYLRQKGSGMRTLSDTERECFKNPHWIGWKKYNLDEFTDLDKEYLESLLQSE